VRGSMRSRWNAWFCVRPTHITPLPGMSSIDPPSGNRAVTRRVAGSMRNSVWVSVSASQADPKPATIWSSPPAGATRAMTFGPAGAVSLLPKLARP
jgi:hypothetical protein